jgi:hypothetical protein
MNSVLISIVNQRINNFFYLKIHNIQIQKGQFLPDFTAEFSEKILYAFFDP